MKKGGFSKEFYEGFDILVNYMNAPVVAGYMGHRARTKELDGVVEEAMTNLKTPDDKFKMFYLATWLTSSDARHFMDKIEDMAAEKGATREEKWRAAKNIVKAIKEEMPHIFNRGFIYSRPEHGGMWSSTVELTRKYEAAGFLMKEN